ncbi:armadillo-type protein [Blyttiomyces helicus]|uniref:Armadillo-type protein n=1 Tax=Blyttiomyces helicus TaxID=388810 RepID=A0A4V1IS62_9FUNG|nr:armadillo-type protein [Blyttiomyces helicus]|eukprot:RKO92447.1 armadillo-type protein [Blyttiomyces helicus]
MTQNVTGLSDEVVAQLVLLLSHLASNDNNTRSAAEAQLNDQWLAAQPAILLAALAQVARSNSQNVVRSLAAVLLRRLALKDAATTEAGTHSFYISIGEDYRGFIQAQLLASLESEQDRSTRRKICDTISELAIHMLENGSTWVELLHGVFECLKSPIADLRRSGLQILGAVPALVNDQSPEAMARFLSPALADADRTVKVEALNAAAQYILVIDETSHAQIAPLIPQMLSVLPSLLTGEATSDEDLGNAFIYLMDLAGEYPALLRSVLPDLVEFVANIMRNANLEDNTRKSAVELLVIIAEANPGMVRKQQVFVNTLVPILLEWISTIEEDEDWYTTDDIDDDDNEDFNMIAAQALDRLAISLGGKTLLPIIFAHVPPMLSDESWSKRHGGLMTISSIAEGCQKIMLVELKNVIGLVLPRLQDPHPRVRWAACNAIGQMSTDFAPNLQNSYCSEILTNLIPVMDDTRFPRVQAHVAAALVNFSEEVEKFTIAPFLDQIFEKLLILLNTGKTYVQEQAITTIATVADSAEDKFVKYYPAIMPLLLSVLQQASVKEFRLLRGKTMECASLIALAVGKETFAPHAAEFVNILRVTQQSITEPDDPQSSYLLSAWARICKVSGDDFLPYLEFVLPPLLASASLKPDFTVIDGEVAATEEKIADGWEFVTVDGKNIGIRTSVLDEKCTAVEMLVCYARELGANFHPWVAQIFEVVLPLFKFYYHEGVRAAATGVVPLLFTSLAKANYREFYTTILAYWAKAAETILSALKDEVDPAFISQLYVSFYESLEVVGPLTVTDAVADEITTIMVSQLEEYAQRHNDRQGSRKNVDFDPEEDAAPLEEQEYDDSALLSELSRTIHEILKAQRETFLPHFNKLVPALKAFMSNPNPEARQWSICVYDDVIEFAGPASVSYQGEFLSAFAAALSDQSADIRQAASYGWGVAAQFGGPAYFPACAEALSGLFAVIGAAGSRSKENVIATENAISAVGKICQFAGASGTFNLDQVLAAWVKTLPIVEDDEEAPATYNYLIDLIEA